MFGTPWKKFVHPAEVYRLEYPAHWDQVQQDEARSCGFGPHERDDVGLWISILPMSVDTDRLADATGPDARRRLPELSAGEDAERPPVARDVAADRVERVVAAGNELLHHGRELLRPRVGVFDLVERLAPEGLAAEAQLEADGMLRLDEHR